MPAPTSEKFAGIALRCGMDGIVQEVISDSLGAGICVQKGESFVNFFDAASQTKAAAFLETLSRNRAAFGWEMNVACQNAPPETIHFAGAADGDEDFLFIVGAKSRQEVSGFYNDIIRINNEQTNALRTAMKDLSLNLREQTGRDNHLYDELSRLNNELTTIQRELAKKNFELARLNEEKNKFLGIASHDLRNPLEVILTYSEFLCEDDDLGEEKRSFIRKIYSSSSFMLNLVNDFLDYSKIEAGRLELSLGKVDLAQFIRRVVEVNRLFTAKKDIEITLDLPENLPPIYLDEAKIEQVLNNLIGNALKFSPTQSVLEIKVEPGDSEIVLSVKDNGPGIAPEDSENLFNPFIKGKAKPTGGEKSTGLGLAIVKKIVEGHGGKVRFETEAGVGTVFFVIFKTEGQDEKKQNLKKEQGV